MKPWQQERLRQLPPVNDILALPRVAALLEQYARPLVVEAVGSALAEMRARILRTASPAEAAAVDHTAPALAEAVSSQLALRLQPHLQRVINATGVVLHTNLGRSPLAAPAIAQIEAIAGRYSNLELDLQTGERGSRYAHVEEILCRLTGAEAAMVVNNNAAAVLLALSALCCGKEVVVSRGELVEIGGSFRVPDVMAQSGARLIEVGTTNKTHRRDYERAISPATGALLKVHPSNFRIVGFTAAVEVAELAALAHEHRLPCLVDWGSGVLINLERFGITQETTVAALMAAGADLVTFSGDKLLGAPQGGFLVGRKELVQLCRQHPLTRALRVDKLTLAGIEATLKLYLEPEKALASIPTLRMLALTAEEIAPLAEQVAQRLRAACPGAVVRVIDGDSQSGGGSLPGVALPTRLVAIAVAAPHEVEQRLRMQEVPVMVRISAGQILIDPRTLFSDEIEPLVSALCHAIV